MRVYISDIEKVVIAARVSVVPEFDVHSWQPYVALNAEEWPLWIGEVDHGEEGPSTITP